MSQNESLPEFGVKRENEERRDGGCAVVFDPATQKYAVADLKKNARYRLFSGGVSDDEDIQEGILREVIEESGLNDFLYVEKMAEAMTHFHNILKKINRVGKATGFLIILKSRASVERKLEEHEKFSLAWVSSKEIIESWENNNENNDYDYWIYFMNKAVTRAKELGYDKTK